MQIRPVHMHPPPLIQVADIVRIIIDHKPVCPHTAAVRICLKAKGSLRKDPDSACSDTAHFWNSGRSGCRVLPYLILPAVCVWLDRSSLSAFSFYNSKRRLRFGRCDSPGISGCQMRTGFCPYPGQHPQAVLPQQSVSRRCSEAHLQSKAVPPLHEPAYHFGIPRLLGKPCQLAKLVCKIRAGLVQHLIHQPRQLSRLQIAHPVSLHPVCLDQQLSGCFPVFPHIPR